MTPAEARDVLEPYAAVVGVLKTLPSRLRDEELLALAEACRWPTQTNCGWTEWEAARFLEEEVDGELYRRAERSIVTFISRHGDGPWSNRALRAARS